MDNFGNLIVRRPTFSYEIPNTFFDMSGARASQLRNYRDLLILFDFTAEGNAIEKPDLTQIVKRDSGFFILFFSFCKRDVYFSCGFNPSFKENWRIR